MYFDRWDVIEAHLLFCWDFHSGQADPLYVKSCRIMSYYTPGSVFGWFSLSDNAKQIYDNLCAKHGFSRLDPSVARKPGEE